MSDILRNHYKGVDSTPFAGKDLTEYLRNENIASLSNFIRYGEYSDGRKHGSLAKNKSIADILMLTDAEVIILINFIEICRLNNKLIYGKVEDYDENLFNKLLVSIQNSPSNLPMFYEDNCIDETVFYYRLIKDLLKWIILYQQFCKMNGVNMLYTVGITDVTIFNGKLENLSNKMSTYLMKVRMVYPFETLEPNKKPLLSREEMNGGHANKNCIIEEISREVLKKLNIVNEHREDCNSGHNKGRNMFKHKYPFEESGFKEPTLIKKNSVVYTDDICNLVKRMEDHDILFIPKNDNCEEKHLVFEGLNKIIIVGKSNVSLDYTFEFRDTTCLIHNISLKATESETNSAILCDGNVTMRIEDCIFNGFKEAIHYNVRDPFSDNKNLSVTDSVFLNCHNGISTDSVNNFTLFDCIFTGCLNALHFEHNLHSKGFIDINSCDFISCHSDENGAIRAINYSTTSRVGIEEIRIQHSRFIDNSIDIIIGKKDEKLTDVVIHTRDNLGLTNIKNLVFGENDSPYETEDEVIIDTEPNKIPTNNEDNSEEEVTE